MVVLLKAAIDGAAAAGGEHGDMLGVIDIPHRDGGLGALPGQVEQQQLPLARLVQSDLDPVAQAVTNRIRDAEDSYFNVCQAWVNNLYQTAEALAAGNGEMTAAPASSESTLPPRPRR